MGLPVSVPAGDFTPGALASLTFAAELINTAWQQANLKHTAFETKIATAQAELPDVSDIAAGLDIIAGTVSAPVIQEPSVSIPAEQSGDDAISLFDTKYLELVAMLTDKFVSFQADYFPDDAASYSEAAAWLQAAVANPNAGIPLAVQEQVFEDDRSRILADAGRATADVLATFATKRFPLPPGAAAAATIEIQKEAQNKIAESSRKVAMASVEQMRFAVEKLLMTRQLAMATAVDYIKALASGPDMASRVVNVGYDAQSKLISAASQFYNSRIAAAELTSKINQFNVSSALQASEKNQSADITMIQTKIETLLTEAKALAQMSASMYNNLHASAGVSYSGSQASTV